MSLWNHRLDQNTNENFDSFCPGPFRAEIVKFFIGILVQTKTSKRHFEINWPLVKCLGKGESCILWLSRSIFNVKNHLNLCENVYQFRILFWHCLITSTFETLYFLELCPNFVTIQKYDDFYWLCRFWAKI